MTRISDGTIISFEVEDRGGRQTLDLPYPIEAKWVQLVINEVYPGSKYEDTALSGLLVDSAAAR